jgi:DNA-binding transcriptional ArsR family regulator
MSQQGYYIMSDQVLSRRKLHNPKAFAPSVYIPYWLIQIPLSIVSANAKLLYGRMAHWSCEQGQVCRSVSQLAQELNLSISDTKEHLKELEENNLIKQFKSSNDKSISFELCENKWINEEISIVYE